MYVHGSVLVVLGSQQQRQRQVYITHYMFYGVKSTPPNR